MNHNSYLQTVKAASGDNQTTPTRHSYAVRYFFSLLCILNIVIFSSTSHADNILRLVPDKLEYELGRLVGIVEDSSTLWTIEDVTSPEFDDKFIRSQSDMPDFGFSNSAYWVRLTIDGQNTSSRDWRLLLDKTNFHYVDFYEQQGDDYRRIKTGNRRHFSTRDFDNHLFIFRVNLVEGETKTLYLRLENGGSMVMPLKLIQAERLYEHEIREQRWIGLFYGAMLIMLLYNSAMGLALRDKSHLYYVACIFTAILFFSYYDGFLQQELMPALTWIQLIPITSGLLFGLLFLFTNKILQLESRAEKLYRLNIVGFYGMCAFVILCFAMSYRAAIILSIPLFALSFFVMVGGSLYCWYKGYPGARSYALSWGALVASLSGYFFSGINGLPIVQPEASLRIGILALVTLLSLALAEQIRRIRVEKRAIQQELADTLIKDNQDMRQLQSELVTLAYEDPVTGLPNRAAFLRTSEELTQGGSDESLWIAIACIDNFRPINERLGQRGGDAVLGHVAERLKSCAPKGCEIFRWIGDSYIIILQGDREDIISTKLNMIKASTADAYIHDRNKIKLTISIGVAAYPEGTSIEALLLDAGLALQEAKQGCDRVVFFDAPMKESEDKYLEIHWAMADALKNEEFSLFYQPIFSTQNQRIEGFEALLRWHNSAGETRFSPNEFIQVAERNGLILELGKFVIQSSIAQAYEWNSISQIPYHISLNISPIQFNDDDFLDVIMAALERFPIKPGLVNLEITESLFAGDSRAVLQKLLVLKDAGLRLSLDDFGTGYSSLAYIQQYPFDTIKIDKCFVNDIHTSKHSQALVSAVLSLANNLSMNVVAEGVETKVQVEYLSNQHIGLLQGFYFSKPLPPDVIAETIIQPRSHPVSAR